jgi:hypothetical protein
MHRRDVDRLGSCRACWIPAVVAPERDWSAAPGCRRGARYMVDRRTLRVTRDEFAVFGSQLSCLRWIMRNRSHLNRALPGARVRAVPLDRWLLGLD